MELWIQPCAACADLYGRPSSVEPHDTLAPGTPDTASPNQHYVCGRCSAVFTRVLSGRQAGQIWMLLNAGQH
ncbi:hypothetical protein [Paraburkholderia sp. BCC1886]|uniref:hypothetical protein n=1 Tax=Paraburkholderia sp. BCC1886 TaxID=2562670 RepID=UPI0011834D11|nr:hypothetical protein [Paraburkholderia sp. BCC1886]